MSFAEQTVVDQQKLPDVEPDWDAELQGLADVGSLDLLDSAALLGNSASQQKVADEKPLLAALDTRESALTKAREAIGQILGSHDFVDASVTVDGLILPLDRILRRYATLAIGSEGEGRLAAMLAAAADGYVGNLRRALVRIAADRADLATTFAEGGADLRLTAIRCTGSDAHKEGGQVLLLTFRSTVGEDTTRVVYKPTDVELEYLLVGDSSRVQATRSESASGPKFAYAPAPQDASRGASMAEAMNAMFPSDSAQIPTHAVLPRNPGSSLAPDEESGALPIGESYGYTEYLSNASHEDDFEASSADQVTKYFAQVGRIAAMALTLAMIDIHQDNLLVHGCEPHLIDVETSLIGSAPTLHQTSLPNGLKRNAASTEKGRQQTDAIQDKQLSAYLPPMQTKPSSDIDPNRLYLQGEVVDPTEYTAVIEAAFQAALDAFSTNENNARLLELLGGLQNVVARVLPFGTDKLKELFNAYATGAAPTGALFAAEMRQDASLGITDGNAMLLGPEHAQKDFENADIPAFYQRLGGRDMLDSRGRSAKKTETSPLEDARTRVRGLGAETEQEPVGVGEARERWKARRGDVTKELSPEESDDEFADFDFGNGPLVPRRVVDDDELDDPFSS